RKKWKGSPAIPPEYDLRKDVRKIIAEIDKAGIKTIGKIDPQAFNWPISRKESLEVLNYFAENLLQHFGDYQDALHTEQRFLFHSRVSFAMNSKMISPKEVIDRVLEEYRKEKAEIDISQVEGFVRQILGWREFMRGVYWREMPEYKSKNALDNQNKLPDFYWTGDTKMNCLSHAINQSLEEAYAHHIQRLMITGNYALLTQTHPDEVDAWYLGVYIDAIEWVEITNTRGMSQFADGGIVATKPYVSSANYINKMGNYCSGCTYDHKKKTGGNACPFNSLYWNFLDAKKESFNDNPRMGMMLNLLSKKGEEEMEEIRDRARQIIENPDQF
ncbi:MAG: cryptochrome/photolyase family protein, partial [Flavobacteriaceae bacterium]|nr:cryptochrome/photolyase family protein [Muriicola sp.]NNL39303.1 cryptochrome/photolyase family protein [Flavobacteriaceae bacterium]